MERDGGVVRTRCGVSHGAGGCGRVGRVGNVPLRDRRGVDAAGGDRVAIGTPPITSEAVHLFGSDEISAAPCHRVGFSWVAPGEDAPCSVEFGKTQQPSARIGDSPGGRIGSRVEHRPGDVDRASEPAQQTGGEQSSTQCECSDLAGMVSRVRGDAAAALSRSLSPGTFLRGKVTAVVGCQQHPRIADQSFHPRCNIEYPQRIHRVRTTGAAQKDHAFTIG